MVYTKLILSGVVFAAAAQPALPAPATYPVKADQVAASANKMGLEISPGQVTMLTDVVTTTTTPSLKVRSIERQDKQGMLVRMECESRDQCLPFIVSIRADSANDMPVIPSSRSLAVLGTPSRSVSPQPVIRTGSPVTLLLDSDRVHIRIPVVCLENGATGQTIRVKSKDHHLIYTAQVIDGTLVKGKL